MALKLITDPDLLKQLNSEEPAQPQRKQLRLVTDPDLLRQLNEDPKESYGEALKAAPGKITKDLGDMILDRIKSIPGYIDKAKTEIPGLGKALINHPANVAKQFGAGLTEMGHGIINTPASLVDYGVNRLNLLPESVSKNVIRQPDISQDINQVFGEPQQPGDAFARGLGRNIESIIGAGGLAKTLNPMKLTSENIVKDVMKAKEQNIEKYSGDQGKYNQLQAKANSRGITGDQINPKQSDLAILAKEMPTDEYEAIDKLMNNKNLTNAQSAISQLGHRERALTAKYDRGNVLTDPEKDLLKAVKSTKKDIQENMFKDANGKVHQDLVDDHKDIQQGYAKEVIPYTKNKSIQKYEKGKKLADELAPLLMRGEFPAQVGSAHPALMLRRWVENHPKTSLTAALGAASAGGIPLGLSLYKLLAGEGNAQ